MLATKLGDKEPSYNKIFVLEIRHLYLILKVKFLHLVTLRVACHSLREMPFCRAYAPPIRALHVRTMRDQLFFMQSNCVSLRCLLAITREKRYFRKNSYITAKIISSKMVQEHFPFFAFFLRRGNNRILRDVEHRMLERKSWSRHSYSLLCNGWNTQASIH